MVAAAVRVGYELWASMQLLTPHRRLLSHVFKALVPRADRVRLVPMLGGGWRVASTATNTHPVYPSLVSRGGQTGDCGSALSCAILAAKCVRLLLRGLIHAGSPRGSSRGGH